MRSTLIRSLAVAAALSPFVFSPARANDNVRIRQLEGEVSRLQRDIAAQARRIDQLEGAVREAQSSVGRASAPVFRRGDDSPAWLVVGNWDRIRPGMKQEEVIAILGRPTSTRSGQDGGTRTLLYALEVSPTAVLAGNVQLDGSGVTRINRPALR